MNTRYRCKTEGQICHPIKKMCCDGTSCKRERFGNSAAHVVHYCVANDTHLKMGDSCARSEDCDSGHCKKQDCSVTQTLFQVDCSGTRGVCAAAPVLSSPFDFKN